MTYPAVMPPPIDPREVRPSRGWFVVAAVIALLGLLAGPILVVVGLGTVGSLAGSLPTIAAEFDSTAPTTVHLSAATKWAIYVESPAGAAGTADAQCTGIAVSGGTIDLTPIPYQLTVSVGSRSWRALYQVSVAQDGQYQVACEPTDPGVDASRYAVGEDPQIGGFIAKVLGAVGAVFGAVLLPCGGLLVGGLIALVVGLRRTSNRKRLQHQRTNDLARGYRPPGYREG